VRDDIDDFLQSLEQLVDIEHRADAQTRAAITRDLDHRGLYLAHQLSGALGVRPMHICTPVTPCAAI